MAVTVNSIHGCHGKAIHALLSPRGQMFGSLKIHENYLSLRYTSNICSLKIVIHAVYKNKHVVTDGVNVLIPNSKTPLPKQST